VKTVFLLERSAQLGMCFLNCRFTNSLFFSYATLTMATTSELLGYGQTSGAYYIKCHDCQEDFARDPKSEFWSDWEKSIHDAEETLKAKYAAIQLP
jgi:hypothetical protein